MSSALRTKLSATMSTPSFAPNSQIVDVFRRQRVCRQLDARSVDALVLVERFRRRDGGDDLVAVRALDLQLDFAVVDEEQAARLGFAHELCVRGVDALGIAFAIAGEDANRLAVSQFDWLAVFQPAGADFRTTEILEDRNDFRGACRRRPNSVKRLRVRFLSAVRKVQPADIHAGSDNLLDDGFASARRTDRRNDFRLTHSSQLTSQRRRRTIARRMNEIVQTRVRRRLSSASPH